MHEEAHQGGLEEELRSWFAFQDRRRELRAAARRFRAAYLAGRTREKGTISPYLVYLLGFVKRCRVLARLSYVGEDGLVRRQRLVEVYELDYPHFWAYDLGGPEAEHGRPRGGRLVRVAGWRTILLRPLVFKTFRPRKEVLERVSRLRRREARRKVRRLMQNLDRRPRKNG
ncbi:MAG TPA: hypothetical protein ENN88_03945 [Candidatus Coatesbacteria bacterium]|nr:hypothetical protein [Candidatus Coatesbacteria bacterium]